MRVVSVAAFDGDDVIGALLDALRASWCWDDALSFVAERDGEIVGQVLYTSVFLDAPDSLARALLLSPLGVRPDLQRQGIGTALVTRSLEQLASRREPAVFLEGNPAYYRRFGFVAAAEHGFRKPSLRIPDSGFQVVPLAASLDASSGTLVYPDAFWLCDAVGLR